MRIARFEDAQGDIHLGTPLDAGQASRLAGQFYGPLRDTGEILGVARWLAPIEPANIFCIGLNYRAHAVETGAAIPVNPVVFMKPTTALNHPGDPIPLPRACDPFLSQNRPGAPSERPFQPMLGSCCSTWAILRTQHIH